MATAEKKRQPPPLSAGDKTDAARHGNRQYRAISFPESRSVWQSRQSLPHGYPDIRPAGAAFSCSPQLLAKLGGHRDVLRKSQSAKTGRHAGLDAARSLERHRALRLHRRLRGLEKRLPKMSDLSNYPPVRVDRAHQLIGGKRQRFRDMLRLGCRFISPSQHVAEAFNSVYGAGAARLLTTVSIWRPRRFSRSYHLCR